MLLAAGGMALPWLAGTPGHAAVPARAPLHGMLFHDQGPLFDNHPEPSATQPVTLTLRAVHGALARAFIEVREAGHRRHRDVPMHRAGRDRSGRFELWRATLPASAANRRYRFKGMLDGRSVWYNALGASIVRPSSGDFFILPGFVTPGWMKNGVMYQIFPDRFFDGDPGNDVHSGQYSYAGCAAEHHAWGTPVFPRIKRCRSMVFYGGDLAGIDDKLGYIRKTLGANILYLNPIFASPTNHKYDTTDYYRVDPAFGSNALLEKLIADIHRRVDGRRGRIILDGVFNHTGDTIAWFDRYHQWPQVGAYESKASPWFGYYTFQHWPDRYSTFGDVKSMPKLDYGAPGSAVRRQIYAGPHSVMQTYLKPPYGIDGWRLDVAQEIDAGGHNGSDVTNHRIMRAMRRAVKSVNPQAEILGEYWNDPAPWLDDGDEWDGVMNYHGFADPVSEWLCGTDVKGQPARLTASAFDAALRRARADVPRNAQETLTNFLGSHDTPRFATRCGGDIRKTGLGLVLQMTYIGTPTIYYGDEYGMEGGNDPDDRRTFDWSKATLHNPSVAMAHRLIALRMRYAALRTGSFITLRTDDADHVYAFGRFDAHHRIAVVLNDSGHRQRVSVPVWQLGMREGSSVTDALGGGAYRVRHGMLEVPVAAMTGAVLVQ